MDRAKKKVGKQLIIKREVNKWSESRNKGLIHTQRILESIRVDEV